MCYKLSTIVRLKQNESPSQFYLIKQTKGGASTEHEREY